MEGPCYLSPLCVCVWVFSLLFKILHIKAKTIHTQPLGHNSLTHPATKWEVLRSLVAALHTQVYIWFNRWQIKEAIQEVIANTQCVLFAATYLRKENISFIHDTHTHLCE